MYNEKLKRDYTIIVKSMMRVVLDFMPIWIKRSHDIIEKSLEMLRRLDHRGGVGADGITGDVCRIMTEIPYQLFEQLTEFKVPGEGYYAGLFFLKRKLEIQFTKRCLINILKVKVLKSLIRDVPEILALLLNMLQILCLIFNKYLLTSQV